jgi:hypothetical protein
VNDRRRYWIDLLKGIGIGSFVAGLVKFEFTHDHHNRLMALTLIGFAVIIWFVGYVFVVKGDNNV